MVILMVEDSKPLGQTLWEVMEHWGYDVRWALTGEDALGEVRRAPFDLIILDISLPDIQGHELIPSLKSIQPETGIVTMTGHNSRELEAKVRREGILYYMVKPFELKMLKEILDHVSSRKRHGEAWKSPRRRSEEIDGPHSNKTLS